MSSRQHAEHVMHIISFNPHTHPVRLMLALPYLQRHWGSNRLTSLPKVTTQREIWTQECAILASTVFLLYIPFLTEFQDFAGKKNQEYDEMRSENDQNEQFSQLDHWVGRQQQQGAGWYPQPIHLAPVRISPWPPANLFLFWVSVSSFVREEPENRGPSSTLIRRQALDGHLWHLKRGQFHRWLNLLVNGNFPLPFTAQVTKSRSLILPLASVSTPWREFPGAACSQAVGRKSQFFWEELRNGGKMGARGEAEMGCLDLRVITM